MDAGETPEPIHARNGGTARRRGIVIGAILACVLALGVLILASRHPVDVGPNSVTDPAPPSNSSFDTATPAPQSRSAPAQAGADDRPLPDFGDGRPYADVRAELEQRAAAGNARAALKLGVTLIDCNGYVAVSDDDIENRVVDVAARANSTITRQGRVLTPVEILEAAKRAAAKKRHECRGLSGTLSDPNALAHSFDWIARAAELGNADAEALYGMMGMSALDPRNALSSAEELRDRKQLGDEYLRRSLAQGDALALLERARQLDAGLFYGDPELAYAYLFAYSMTDRAARESPDLDLEQAASRLDPAARLRAETRAAELAACCLHDPRGWP